MRRRLYLVAALSCALFAIGGGLILLAISGMVENENVDREKGKLAQQFYDSLGQLQQAQLVLYKHQAGFDPQVDDLVTAVERFDETMAAVQAYYRRQDRPGSCRRCHRSDLDESLSRSRNELTAIAELTGRYKDRISVMLTTMDADQRDGLEKEVSHIGSAIVARLEGLVSSVNQMVAATEIQSRVLLLRARSAIVAIVVVVTVALVALLYVMIPPVTRGIEALIGGTEALAAGDLGRRVEVPAVGEISLLAERFNRMAESLSARDLMLLELQAGLEAKVRERTAALQESNAQLHRSTADLESAYRDLRELDRLKSDFITIASHELRTPLVTISGYVDLLRNGAAGELTPPQAAMVETVERSAARLSRVLRGILDLSRLESQKLQPRTERVEVGPLMEEAVADQVHFAEVRGQSIFMESADGLPGLTGDHDMLAQVLINLVNNAIKFTPNGGSIRLSASARSRRELEERLSRSEAFVEQVGVVPPGSDFLELTVADTGIGVPPEERRRIFDRFYEVGDSLTHSSGDFKFMGGGMGLGLSISKAFVEKHGGAIWVDSRGRDPRRLPGSVFHVLLPVGSRPAPLAPSAAAPAPAAAAPVVAAVAPPGASPGDRRAPTVLVVDDDPDILRFMEVLLNNRYRVLVAPNGTSGLNEARRERPDLILLDLLMYDLDGYQVLKALRGEEDTRSIPVILFTAKVQKQDIEEGLQAGADGYITKPFTNEELFSKIDTALKAGRR